MPVREPSVVEAAREDVSGSDTTSTVTWNTL
jgi:hypothetical protein